MEKKKCYENTFFQENVIRRAISIFTSKTTFEELGKIEKYFSIDLGEESWKYDNEDDFFEDYKSTIVVAMFEYRIISRNSHFQVFFSYPNTYIEVGSNNRTDIQDFFDLFDTNTKEAKLRIRKTRVKNQVFIGHGRNPLWRDLKDHLQDKHNYSVIAYEIGARAGLSIKEILENMLEKSNLALLVLTGEDETSEGQLLARQNVIHELGLFQGKLGFDKTIVLLEDGTEEFSNIHGLQQIRFSKGNIKETYGEVLATIRREIKNKN